MTSHPDRVQKSWRFFLISALSIAVVLALAATGIVNRAKSKQEVEAWTNEQAVPTVRIVTPVPGPSEEQLILPGDVKAFNTGSIYARASGYVTAWYMDIGALVKKGEVLATIDSPELDQQLAQARADLATAAANKSLAQVTAARWKSLAARSIVSQQEKDEKVGDDEAKSAAVKAAEANVARIEALTVFKNLTAPFDGVVTARSVEMGDLVNAGGISGKALFQVSDTHEMRVYVNVPQAFLTKMKAGLKATLHLPGQEEVFEATLVSTSNAITENSRTALIQLQAQNLEGKLWPGAYTEVHFHLPSEPAILRIPATALVFGPEGMNVVTLSGDKRVEVKHVQVGRNLGSDVEIVSGITKFDRLVDSPPETMATGDLVHFDDAASSIQLSQH